MPELSKVYFYIQGWLSWISEYYPCSDTLLAWGQNRQTKQHFFLHYNYTLNVYWFQGSLGPCSFYYIPWQQLFSNIMSHYCLFMLRWQHSVINPHLGAFAVSVLSFLMCRDLIYVKVKHCLWQQYDFIFKTPIPCQIMECQLVFIPYSFPYNDVFESPAGFITKWYPFERGRHRDCKRKSVLLSVASLFLWILCNECVSETEWGRQIISTCRSVYVLACKCFLISH